MTVAAAGFAHRDRGELRRWGVSLAVVLLLHIAAGLYIASRRVPLDAAGGPPPAAVMIDLAPLPAPTPPAPAPPEPAVEPQPQPLVPPPPPLPPEPILLPKVDPSPAPRPAIVLPKPPPKAKLKPVERPPETLPERPPPAAAPAPTAPAPATAPPAVNAGAVKASWEAQLVGWLERYKRYPRLAQEQRQEGVVHLSFTMDRAGRVLAAHIDGSSGYPLLDEEVSALIQRAQPLPVPPPEVSGAQITLSLPVQFSLRAGRR